MSQQVHEPLRCPTCDEPIDFAKGRPERSWVGGHGYVTDYYHECGQYLGRVSFIEFEPAEELAGGIQ